MIDSCVLGTFLYFQITLFSFIDRHTKVYRNSMRLFSAPYLHTD